MTFVAHLKYHNILDGYKLKRDCILFTAQNFTNAMGIIEDCYGDDLYSITLLEPISDSDLLHINEKVEEIIRGFEENGF